MVVGLLLVWLLVRVVGWFVDRRRARKDPAWAERRRKREMVRLFGEFWESELVRMDLTDAEWEEQAAVWWGEQPRAASEVDDAR